jgi:hypothetical protein
MRFPSVARVANPRVLLGMASAMAFVAAGATTATAVADDDVPPPPLHRVHYTVWSEQPFFVSIYYREVDPPNWGDYSHDPYQFSPKAEADVGPDSQWNLDVSLANPDEWAMVAATAGPGAPRPNIHCALAVDGVVVSTNQGPKGALCSIRNW